MIRRNAPWFDKIKAPIRAVNIGGLFVLERWILPTFTEWGDEDRIIDQHSFSMNCVKRGNCDDLKARWWRGIGGRRAGGGVGGWGVVMFG